MNACLRTGANVLLSWQFMLNLAVILVITCWVPLLSQTMEMRDSDGNLVQQSTRASRAYESWWVVLRLAPGTKTHLMAVALHLGMCFPITFVVWFIRMYPRREAMDNASRERAESLGNEENLMDMSGERAIDIPPIVAEALENRKDTMDNTP